MYLPKVNTEGLSLSANRVALPSLASLQEVYKELPSDLRLGQKAVLESPNLKAILCKAGDTDITRWHLTEANPTYHHDTTSAAAAAGAKEIQITEGSVSANAYQGGKLWLVSGTGLSEHPLAYSDDTYAAQQTYGGWRQIEIATNAASATVGGVNNVVKITLAEGLPAAIPSGSSVIIEAKFLSNTRLGTASGEKALGQTLVTVPKNHYYWAVYKGDVIAAVTALDISAITASPMVAKGGGGRVHTPLAATTGRELVGKVKEILSGDTTAGDFHIVTLDIQGIEGISPA